MWFQFNHKLLHIKTAMFQIDPDPELTATAVRLFEELNAELLYFLLFRDVARQFWLSL